MKANEYFSDPKVQALAEAAAKGDLAGIGKAIAAGANVNAIGQKDMTPLFFALASKNTEGIKTLMKAGADAGHIVPGLGTAVTLAASVEDAHLLSTLLASGANPDSHNQAGEPAIITAVMHRNFDHIQLLLGAGANINAVDAGGDTAAITLAALNQYEQVAKLIEQGADVQHIANGGITIANILDRSLVHMDPKSSNYQWGLRVKQMLESKGVTFPAPTAVELRKRKRKDFPMDRDSVIRDKAKYLVEGEMDVKDNRLVLVTETVPFRVSRWTKGDGPMKIDVLVPTPTLLPWRGPGVFALDKTPDGRWTLVGRMKGISREQASDVAEQAIMKMNVDYVIIKENTREELFGWIFFLTTERHLRTHDPNDLLPGQGLVVVDRTDGSTHFLSSSVPPDQAITEYERQWREHQGTK